MIGFEGGPRKALRDSLIRLNATIAAAPPVKCQKTRMFAGMHNNIIRLRLEQVQSEGEQKPGERVVHKNTVNIMRTAHSGWRQY